MSPPMDLALVPGRIAYALSKLGMTMLTLGLAEELRGGQHRRQQRSGP